MIRIFSIGAALMSFLWTPLVTAGGIPGTDRTAAFVVGETTPFESFGTMEGPILFGLGVLALLCSFVFLWMAAKNHEANLHDLEHLESQLLPEKRNDHA